MNQKKQLDLSSFEKAIFQLQDSLDYYQQNVHQDHRFRLHMRAAAIQAFEFTYELSWKMLKRYLEINEPDPHEIDKMSFADLIRTGNERGLLLSDLSAWKVFRHERSITSHTYDLTKANEIFENLPNFLKEANYLLNQLKNRNLHG